MNVVSDAMDRDRENSKKAAQSKEKGALFGGESAGKDDEGALPFDQVNCRSIAQEKNAKGDPRPVGITKATG